MSKKQSIDLRAVAESKVSAWRVLHDEAEARNAEVTADVRARGLYRESLERTKLELKYMEAREREDAALREAITALDAYELEAGLEDARGRDLRLLKVDLVELLADVERARAALNAASARVEERVRAAQRAESATAARRQAAGLPFAPSGFVPNPAKSYVASADEAIARGIPSSHCASEIKRLRALLISTAAKLEEERLANEAKAKQTEWERRMDQQKADDTQRRARERAKEQNDLAAEEDRRRDDLAAAYLARVGGV